MRMCFACDNSDSKRVSRVLRSSACCCFHGVIRLSLSFTYVGGSAIPQRDIEVFELIDFSRKNEGDKMHRQTPSQRSAGSRPWFNALYSKILSNFLKKVPIVPVVPSHLVRMCR